MIMRIAFATLALFTAVAVSAQASSSGTKASSAPSAAGTMATASAADGDGPVITNGPVAEYISDSSATVGWATAQPAEMAIRYGTSADHLNQVGPAKDTSQGRAHHATLQGLRPSTRYYFQVTQNGTPVGRVGTFETVANGAAPSKSKAVVPE